MKRFAVLALAAVFAFSFTAGVAAAPEFNWEFTVETDTVLDADTDPINFEGGPETSLSLEASEDGLWNLSIDLDAVESLEIGEYALTLTPGPFDFTVWGGGYELSEAADRFGFISSADEVDGPKYRLATSQAGVDLTADYDTDDANADSFYVFANAGMIGAAFADEDLSDENDGMVASADVKVDLGIATVTGGFGYDMQVADENNGALAFGVTAESEIAAGLTVNGGFTSDGREAADPTNTIEGGVEYVLDVHTISAGVTNESTGDATPIMTINGDYAYGETANLGVEYVTDDSDNPTLTFTADAEYTVIPDVFTISGDFLMVNDQEVGFAEGDDYEWIDGQAIGDAVVTVMKLNASADYTLTPPFVVTPGFGYAAYTFETGEASAMTLSVDGEYTVSDSASITVGFENASGTASAGNAAGIADAKVTTLSTGVTVSF